MTRTHLAVHRLEDRTTPTAVGYRPQTQTLLLNAANGEALEVRIAGPNSPAGAIVVNNVADPDNPVPVFNSTDPEHPYQSVRSLHVNFSRVANGSLFIGPGVRLGGNLDLLGARQTQSFTLFGKVAGNLSYSDLAGAADTVVVGGLAGGAENAGTGGSLSLRLGEGANSVQLKTATVGGNLLVGGKDGPDAVEVLELGPVTVGGSANFALGNGVNSLVGKAANRLTTGRDFLYNGLAGADTLDFITAGSDLTAGGLAQVKLGGIFAAGANYAFFDNAVVGGAMSVTGGRGYDDVRFYGGLTAGGDFTFTGGDGYNYLDFNYASAATNTIGGKVMYTGGVNLDVIYVDGTTIGKSAVFDLKEAVGLPDDSTDPLYNKQGVRLGQWMAAGNRIYGHFGIKATGPSTNVNFIDIARTEVFNGLTIALGDGVDIVRVNDSNVQGEAKFNLGGGVDDLRLETDDADGFGVLLDGTSSFGGPVTVLGGLGDDSIVAGLDGDPAFVVRFGGRLTLDGGPGDDDLSVGDQTVFFGGPVLTSGTW